MAVALEICCFLLKLFHSSLCVTCIPAIHGTMKQVKEVNVHNAVFLYSFSISIVEKLKS